MRPQEFKNWTFINPGLWLILAVLPFLIYSCAPRTELTKRERQEVDKTFRQLGFTDHPTGLLIREVETGKVHYAHSADHLFTPASNLKLLTWYMVQRALPDTLPVFAWLETQDSLIIHPFGDPTFLHPQFDSMQYGVSFLREKNKPVHIFIDHFTDRRYGPGWSWDDYPYGFQREKTPIPVFGNALWVKRDSVSGELQFIPGTGYLTFDSLGQMGAPREEWINRFRLDGYIPEDRFRSIPLRMTDILTLRFLRDTLQTSVSFSKKNIRRRSWADTLFAAPQDTVLRHMLWHSDNFVAEQLLLMVGAYTIGQMDGSTCIDSFTAANPWLDRVDLAWRDGSGLSIYNKCSPRFLCDLLDSLVNIEGLQTVKSHLPCPGCPGTLENWPGDEGPFLYAKSGSLSWVYNLSGLLNGKSGKTYLFSFMNNNFAGSHSHLKERMATLLSFLREKL